VTSLFFLLSQTTEDSLPFFKSLHPHRMYYHIYYIIESSTTAQK